MSPDKNNKEAKNEDDVHPVIAYLRTRWVSEDDLQQFLDCKENSMQKHRNNGLRCASLGRDRLYDVDDIEAYLHSRKVASKKGEKHFPIPVRLFGHFNMDSSDITAAAPVAVVYIHK